jgi:hypothetical protein
MSIRCKIVTPPAQLRLNLCLADSLGTFLKSEGRRQGDSGTYKWAFSKGFEMKGLFEVIYTGKEPPGKQRLTHDALRIYDGDISHGLTLVNVNPDNWNRATEALRELYLVYTEWYSKLDQSVSPSPWMAPGIGGAICGAGCVVSDSPVIYREQTENSNEEERIDLELDVSHEICDFLPFYVSRSSYLKCGPAYFARDTAERLQYDNSGLLDFGLLVTLTGGKLTFACLSRGVADDIIEGLKELKKKYVKSLVQKEKKETDGWIKI